MGKPIVAILGLAVLAAAASYALRSDEHGDANHYAAEGSENAENSELSAPARQLDNVRRAASRIEGEGEARLESMLEKSK